MSPHENNDPLVVFGIFFVIGIAFSVLLLYAVSRGKLELAVFPRGRGSKGLPLHRDRSSREKRKEKKRTKCEGAEAKKRTPEAQENPSRRTEEARDQSVKAVEAKEPGKTAKGEEETKRQEEASGDVTLVAEGNLETRRPGESSSTN
jgi:hypothetical protein